MRTKSLWCALWRYAFTETCDMASRWRHLARPGVCCPRFRHWRYLASACLSKCVFRFNALGWTGIALVYVADSCRQARRKSRNKLVARGDPRRHLEKMVNENRRHFREHSRRRERARGRSVRRDGEHDHRRRLDFRRTRLLVEGRLRAIRSPIPQREARLKSR